MKLLENVSENGEYGGPRRDWVVTRDTPPFSVQTVYVWGTFDDSTIQIQFSPDGVEWFTPPNGTFTAKTIANLSISSYFIRAVVTGAGASTSVSMTVI